MKRITTLLILAALLAWLYKLLFCPREIEFCSDTATRGNWRKLETRRTDYVTRLEHKDWNG